MNNGNKSIGNSENIKFHSRQYDSPVTLLLITGIASFSACFIAELAEWYLVNLSYTYEQKLYVLDNNHMVFQAFIANSLAAAYVVQMALLLALFFVFYLIASRMMRVEPRLFLVISTFTGSFVGNFAGYMIFVRSVIYIPFLSHGTLTLAETFQQSIFGDLLFSSITGSWLLTTLVALGGFLLGGMQQLTEKS